MLIFGGVVLLLFALLSMSGPRTGGGSRRLEHFALGTLGVCACVFLLFRSGLPWAALGIPIVWSVAQRRFGDGAKDAERAAPRSAAPPVRETRMTRDEALTVLGLEADATRDAVLAAYRRLMKKVHPDVGGTTYLATRLNEAKDALLGG